MSGEVGSLVGVRVVSHERSRLADLPRRQGICPRHAGPYPSDCCGCVSWCALLAGDHRCREAVTARDVNSIDAFERGQSIAPMTSSFLCENDSAMRQIWISNAGPLEGLLPKKPPILRRLRARCVFASR